MMSAVGLWQRITVADDSLCLWVNGISHWRVATLFFGLISRLGDGIFWYALIVALPLLYGGEGARTALAMVIAGLLNLLLYRKCKMAFARERPYVTLPPIHLAAVPLDRYSFPSGHTLHAVSFSVIATTAFPQLGSLLIPFAILVAISRPLLGLHYPSDVLVAAVGGYAMARGVIFILPL